MSSRCVASPPSSRIMLGCQFSALTHRSMHHQKSSSVSLRHAKIEKPARRTHQISQFQPGRSFKLSSSSTVTMATPIRLAFRAVPSRPRNWPIKWMIRFITRWPGRVALLITQLISLPGTSKQISQTPDPIRGAGSSTGRRFESGSSSWGLFLDPLSFFERSIRSGYSSTATSLSIPRR